MTPTLRHPTSSGLLAMRRDPAWQAAFAHAGHELLLDRHLERARRRFGRVRTTTQAAELLDTCDRMQEWLDELDERTFDPSVLRRVARLRRRVERARHRLEHALRRPALRSAIVRELFARSDTPLTARRGVLHEGGDGTCDHLVAVSGRVCSPRVRLVLHLYRRREVDGSWLVVVPADVHTALSLAGQRDHFQVSRGATVTEEETLDAACALWSADTLDLYHDPQHTVNAVRWLLQDRPL